MTGNEIEKALQELLGASAGPSGLVITLRRHEEYEALIGRINVLEGEKSNLKMEVSRMSSYAELYLRALDELKIAARNLEDLGVDTSWITSIKTRRR